MEQIKIVEYQLGDDIMKIIQNTLYDIYNGKVEFTGPDPKVNVDVKTGIAGMMGVDRAVREMIINSGLVINASEISNIANHSNEENVSYTSYIIPFLANVRFIIDPVMDPMKASDEINPYINGFRTSSYSYVVEQKDQVYEIVCVGKLPVFQEELLKLVRESKIADKYEMYPTKVVKYIMNALKNLE